MTQFWDWQFVWQNLPALAEAAVLTFVITILASLLAYVLGLVLAVLRRSSFFLVNKPVGAFVEFVRSTPPLVQILLLWYVLPDYGVRLSAVTTGVLGLGLHYATYNAEVYRAGIEGVPRGQWEAATALSLSRFRIWVSVILPQAIPRVVPALGNYTISMFKEVPLLVGIGVTALVGTADNIGASTYRYVELYTLAGAFFLFFSLCAAFVVRMLERRLANF